ncbi:MAG: AAA family ATPase [Solirubrobacteraceae bacterium]
MPLVGREPELATAAAVLAGAEAGTGTVLFVTGEAGIGKSRLLGEMRERFGGRWLEGHCASYGDQLSYWPFRELLRDWLGAGADEPELRVRIALRRELERLFGRGRRSSGRTCRRCWASAWTPRPPAASTSSRPRRSSTARSRSWASSSRGSPPTARWRSRWRTCTGPTRRRWRSPGTCSRRPSPPGCCSCSPSAPSPTTRRGRCASARRASTRTSPGRSPSRRWRPPPSARCSPRWSAAARCPGPSPSGSRGRRRATRSTWRRSSAR